VLAVQRSVPASWMNRQSPFVLHSTQVPAMFEFVVSPQTCAPGSLPDVQGVPVGAFAKEGLDGDPVQAGSMRHAEFDVGRSPESSMDIEPPDPLQTTFWQSPGV
jgi:hypothetical protein